jgi:hypothetical protein
MTKDDPHGAGRDRQMAKSLGMSRRWFQFSLRGFLIAVTLLTVWLGWTVQRARSRGAVIDAIVKAGGTVVYETEGIFMRDLADYEYVGHFWPDMKRLPVQITLDSPPDTSIEKCLERAAPFQSLYIWGDLSDEALLELHRRLPGVPVTTLDHQNGRFSRIMGTNGQLFPP